MKIHPVFIIPLLLLGSSCGLSPEDVHARKSMERSLTEYFMIHHDSSFHDSVPMYDIWLLGEVWTTPAQIDSFSVRSFHSLEEVYTHNEKLRAFAYHLEEMVGHYSFPRIEKDEHVPDSIRSIYNDFSDAYHRGDTSISIEHIQQQRRRIKSYLSESAPSHSGFKCRTEVWVSYESKERVFSWWAYFDLDRNFLHYTEE